MHSASTETISLSALVARAAGHGARDEAFVRGFAAWFAERADRLSFQVIERLGLQDVVVTFKMKDSVRLIITGYPPEELPGEVTVTIDERDFPFVEVALSSTCRPHPYEFCTLDYIHAGRTVSIAGGPYDGQQGRVVVSATIAGREEHRVDIHGHVVTLGPEVLTFAP